MNEFSLLRLVVLPVGLGLLGFLEPCSMGSTLVFTKYLEGKNPPAKLAQVGIFTLTRALLIGALGVLAVLFGTVFLGVQKGVWIVLGTIYALIGASYVLGKAGILMRAFGPSLSGLSGRQGSAALGVLFGLNVPACAAPLIFVLFGMAAAGGAAGGTLASGFLSLALFGLALSLPLVLAVFFGPARQVIDWLAGLSARIPFWTGLALIVLGLWSIGFGLFVDLADWV